MTFTAAQTKVLRNLDQYAERKFHVTPEYQAICFEHVLGIYLEFGAYRIFEKAIDEYNGVGVGAYHDFSQQMFMLGISHDDFRLPEVLAIVAKEIKTNPAGPLKALLQRGKAKFYDFKPPYLLCEDGAIRFNLGDYLDVYAASFERFMPEAAADPEQHESLVMLLNAIKDVSPEHFAGISTGLHYVVYKEGFAYDNILRQTVLGPNVDTNEVLERLKCMVTHPAEAESGDFSLGQASRFLTIVDAQITRHGVAAKQFIGKCPWLVQAVSNSGMNLKVHATRHSALLLYLVEELETRGFEFEREVIARTVYYYQGLAFKQMERRAEDALTREEHIYLQDFCNEVALGDHLDSAEGRLKCLTVGFTSAKNGSPWLSQFMGKLIDRIDPQVVQQAVLNDLQCMGLYNHTGKSRDIQRIRSAAARDRIFGSDLGL